MKAASTRQSLDRADPPAGAPAPPRWRRALVPVGILLLAAGLRLTNLYYASQLPVFTHHRLDASLYHRAGQAIARGDLTLGREVLHMSPLYSYLVGLVYTVAGAGPWPLRLVQLAMGVATVGFVYATAHRLFGRPGAVVAGLACACYGPLVFYEGQISTAGPLAFLNAAILWSAVRAYQRRKDRGAGRRWLVTGLVWGAAVIVRPSALLLALPLLLLVQGMARPLLDRRRLKWMAALVLGSTLMIAPVTLRNGLVAGEWVLVTDSAGLNFYIGNGAGATGTFRIPDEMPGARNAWAQFEAFRDVAESRVGRRLTSAEVNRYWIDFTWSQIDDDLSRWLALLAEKARLFWNDAELPNTHHYRFHRQLNPLLGLPLVQFGWIAPFALLGLPLLFLRRDREGVFLALTVLVGMAALVLFFVLAHYRLPLVPALLLTAVASIVQLGRWLSAHRFVEVLLASLLLSGGSFLAFMPTGFAERLDDEYFKLGYAYHVEGDLDAAQQAYRQALAENPENLSARGRLAQLYEQRGDLRAAVVEWVHVGRIANRLGALRYEREARDQLRRLGVVPEP